MYLPSAWGTPCRQETTSAPFEALYEQWMKAWSRDDPAVGAAAPVVDELSEIVPDVLLDQHPLGGLKLSHVARIVAVRYLGHPGQLRLDGQDEVEASGSCTLCCSCGRSGGPRGFSPAPARTDPSSRRIRGTVSRSQSRCFWVPGP